MTRARVVFTFTLTILFTLTLLTACGGGGSSSSSMQQVLPPAPRTVTVNFTNTYWTPTGPVQVAGVPANSLGVSALVPQRDGSLTVLPGSTTAPGVVNIANVPTGFYWLTFGPVDILNPLASSAYWTSTSTFDSGRDIAGPPINVLSSPFTTTFDFNLSGLESAANPTSVEFNAQQTFPPLFLLDFNGSSTISQPLETTSNIDWSKVNTAFLTQYVPASLGSLNNLVLGPEATLSNLSLTNGATNPITATLQATSPASLNFSVQGSQWAALFNNASPSTATPSFSAQSIYTEPYVTDRNALGLGLGSNITLAATSLQNIFGFGLNPFASCDPAAFPPLSILSQPAIVTDENFGALQYGDPFPSSWTRALSFCEEATVPIAIPNSSSTANFALVNGGTVALSSAALTPVVSPVQNATINGASFFSPASLNTGVLTLQWSAPTGATPYGYRISAFVQITEPTGLQTYEPTALFHTAQTSVVLPPLSGGNTYIFAITAEVDGTANMESAPFRSSLPTGFATVVSAPVTIGSGAASPAIQGDASAVTRLSQPQPSAARR